MPGEVSREFADCAFGVSTFQIEATEVETSRGQFPVQDESLLIGLGGLLESPGAVIGQPKMIPRLGVSGDRPDSALQPLHRLLDLAFVQQALALEQRPRAGRSATGQPQGDADDQEACLPQSNPVFGGQH